MVVVVCAGGVGWWWWCAQCMLLLSLLQLTSRSKYRDVVLGHNDVALLQKNLESTQLDITSKSRDLELKQITSSDKALELGRIRWIVENLYERTKAKAKTRVLKASASACGR